MNAGETWKCKVTQGILYEGRLSKIKEVTEEHVFIYVAGEAQMAFTKKNFLDCYEKEKKS